MKHKLLETLSLKYNKEYFIRVACNAQIAMIRLLELQSDHDLMIPGSHLRVR
jgi:hypothetical protein